MTSGKKHFVSIVCPVLNTARTIEKTLECIFEIDYPRDAFELVIADGGSTDGTIAIIKRWSVQYPQIKLVEVPGSASPGFARNAALKVISGDYVLFTDGDCAPAGDWIIRLLEPLQNDKQIGIVGGEILTLRTDADNLIESYCEQVGFLSVSGRCGLTQNGYMPRIERNDPHEINGNDCPFFATANLALPRKVLEDIGAEFWHEITGEDVDFCLRIQNKGYKLYFAKEAIVRHMHRISLASHREQWHGYGYGHPLLVKKHARQRLEFVFQYARKRNILLNMPFGTKGIIYLGDFHFLHAFGILFVLGLVGSWVFPGAFFLKPVKLATFLLTVLFTLKYFWPCLKLKPRSKIFTWCRIRYLTNQSYIRGALKGMKKFGTICLEASW